MAFPAIDMYGVYGESPNTPGLLVRLTAISLHRSERFVHFCTQDSSMPGRLYARIYELAEPHHGYVTTADAEARGISRFALARMAERGVLERVFQGVYRLSHFPLSPVAQYMEATLWPRSARGVLSHDTALRVHEISDVNPTKIHLTIPPDVRTHRTVPRVYQLHHADLAPTEIDVIDELPVTTPVRTIRDCQARGLGPALVRAAIADGRRSGKLSRREADQLTREVLNSPAARRRRHSQSERRRRRAAS
jgi:predicted transcriptional regulator of viral defense system